MEIEKFYVIREKTNPKSNGFTIRVKDGKLENLTGNDSDLIKMCFLDSKGNLTTFEKYSYEEIDCEIAKKNEEDYTFWILTQCYVEDTTSPEFFMRGCDF